MLLHRQESAVLLIDVQEKLAPKVFDAETMTARCAWVIDVAQALNVPVYVSEQYPQGLSGTVPTLAQRTTAAPRFEKVAFSSMKTPAFAQHIAQSNKTQMVVIGIETHVCVLQSVLDLLAQDYIVFVVVDAVRSRSEQDHHYGLKRMKQAGAQLVTPETVLFEWLEQAGSDEFKQMSQRFLPR